MNYRLKNLINRFFDLLDSVMKKIGSEHDLAKLCRTEMISYMVYLSAADGVISKSEADAVEFYLGVSLSPASMKTLYEKFQSSIYDGDFANKGSYAVEFLVVLDNIVLERGGDPEFLLSEFLAFLYKEISVELAGSDANVSSKEVDVVTSYLGAIERYLDSHLDSRR